MWLGYKINKRGVPATIRRVEMPINKRKIHRYTGQNKNHFFTYYDLSLKYKNKILKIIINE